MVEITAADIGRKFVTRDGTIVTVASGPDKDGEFNVEMHDDQGEVDDDYYVNAEGLYVREDYDDPNIWDIVDRYYEPQDAAEPPAKLVAEEFGAWE